MNGTIRRLAQRYLGGHVTVGPLAVYGFNAMHVAVNLAIRSLGVYLCAHPTVDGRPWYVYVSRDATPGRAVLGWGPGLDRDDRAEIAARWAQAVRSDPPGFR